MILLLRNFLLRNFRLLRNDVDWLSRSYQGISHGLKFQRLWNRDNSYFRFVNLSFPVSEFHRHNRLSHPSLNEKLIGFDHHSDGDELTESDFLLF